MRSHSFVPEPNISSKAFSAIRLASLSVNMGVRHFQMRARRCDELGQVTLSALKIARRAPQTLRRDLPDCFRSIASLKTSIWGNGQELPRQVPSVAEKKGRCNVRFCSHSGLQSDIAPCPKCAISGHSGTSFDYIFR